MLGAVAPYAALIITHLSVVSSRQRSIMIGEDVKNKFVAHCFILNLAELVGGMSADEVLEKLK